MNRDWSTELGARTGPRKMDVSVSAGHEGSQPRGREGENGKQKTQGGTGAQGLRRVRVEKKKCLLFEKCISQGEKYIDFAWSIGHSQKQRGKR